jgi:glycosyltransferase involved in cell wall biosynthesis
MTPLVSVVLPVHNGQSYLRAAIESVLTQTHRPIELVVVDDGSTDASADLAASYGPRLVLVRQENGGVAAARNAGIRAARGDLIAFLDQDDWWLPAKLAKQVACFQREESIGLVHTATCHFDDTRSAFAGSSGPATEVLTGHCYEELLLRNGIYNSSVMVSRQALDTVGLLDTSIEGNTVQDYDLWLRIAQHFPLAFVPERLTIWRLHPGQGYWSRSRMLTQELRLLDRITREHPGRLSAAMQERMAALLTELGEAHLEARQRGAARRYFARALWTHWSRRTALLFALAFLPCVAGEGLRQFRAQLRHLAGKAGESEVPLWITHATRTRREAAHG